MIGGFMFNIQKLDDLPIKYSDRLWYALLDHVTVSRDETLTFTFKNGQTIRKEL